MLHRIQNLPGLHFQCLDVHPNCRSSAALRVSGNSALTMLGEAAIVTAPCASRFTRDAAASKDRTCSKTAAAGFRSRSPAAVRVVPPADRLNSGTPMARSSLRISC